jgi:hypothetical protein
MPGRVVPLGLACASRGSPESGDLRCKRNIDRTLYRVEPIFDWTNKAAVSIAAGDRGCATMGYRTLREQVGPPPLDPSRRRLLQASAHASTITRSLAELRRHRKLTQVEVAERLERAQASISAMEAANDHFVSTIDGVVCAMGGRLEMVAVFDDERVVLDFI